LLRIDNTAFYKLLTGEGLSLTAGMLMIIAFAAWDFAVVLNLVIESGLILWATRAVRKLPHRFEDAAD
jgi:hypothetical protein